MEAETSQPKAARFQTVAANCHIDELVCKNSHANQFQIVFPGIYQPNRQMFR